MLRSTTGCLTCRKRRVKCDEEKPTCKRCNSSGRRCDGYSNKILPRKRKCHPTKDQDSASPVILPPGADPPKDTQAGGAITIRPKPDPLRFHDKNQAACFDFFHRHTKQQFNEWQGLTKLWNQLIPQLAAVDPLVQHAVIALSAVHMDFEFGDVTGRQFAMKQYGIAVSHMSKAIEKQQDVRNGDYDLHTLLAAMLIFHCFEIFLGNYSSARIHLRSGLRLISEAQDSNSSNSHIISDTDNTNNNKPDDSLDDLIMAFRRLDYQAKTFGDTADPEHHDVSTLLAYEQHTPYTRFTSLQQAQDALADLGKWAFHINHASPACPEPVGGSYRKMATSEFGLSYLDMHRARCQALLRHWSVPFKAYTASMTPAARTSARATIALMEVYQTFGLVVCSLDGLVPRYGERVTDTMHGEFEDMVTKIEDIVVPALAVPAARAGGTTKKVLSYDLGIVAPLFMVASKCRDPELRRRALVLMERSHRREGVWDSGGAARVATRVMEIEEAGLGEVKCAADVPGSNRVARVHVKVTLPERKVDTWFVFRPADIRSTKDWPFIHDTIRF